VWSLANIASADRGLALIQSLQPNFVQLVTHICTRDSNVAIRGFVLCALGLVARTIKVLQLLELVHSISMLLL
jgi:hypothetical protein